MKQAYNYGEKPVFNQASLFIESLDRLNGMVDQSLVEGNLLNVYRIMNRIYDRLEAYAEENKDKVYLTKDFTTYKKDIEDAFKKIEALILDPNKSTVQANAVQIEKQLSAVNRMIFRVQWGLHLVLPQSSKQTFEEKLKVGYE